MFQTKAFKEFRTTVVNELMPRIKEAMQHEDMLYMVKLSDGMAKVQQTHNGDISVEVKLTSREQKWLYKLLDDRYPNCEQVGVNLLAIRQF
ncbi:MAG TPA: hypothetical protein VH144_02625 [Candidatus Saccharimonadales bacterium]|jgi:hypothetical protein|nr:hypothetical protein [Candidatus Saccharimonadales bacterium]